MEGEKERRESVGVTVGSEGERQMVGRREGKV